MIDLAKQRAMQANLHTHTSFCDGKNTVREMVEAALEAGMRTLGFSGHSSVYFDKPFSMLPENTVKYREEILSARAELGDRLHILMGIEQDYFSDVPAVGYDYILGSVHYLQFDGIYFPIDQSREDMIETVNRFCKGDFYRYTSLYYEHMASLVEKTACDIVGHFDLVMKFNEDGSLFDPGDPRYLSSAIGALDALLDRDVVFEINTGAISRGYRTMPYPHLTLLHRIAERHGRVTITSDAHDKRNLQYGFSEAVDYARAAGLSSLEVMGKQGWESVLL